MRPRTPLLNQEGVLPKGDISWKRRTDEGERLEIYARQTGGNWIFYSRTGRNERWQVLADPPQEDWLELLDAVQRRVDRQFIRPEEAEKLKQVISTRFGGAQ